MGIFTKIPLELSVIRKIPKEGKWAILIKELPINWNELPIKFNKLDIIYIYNEQISESELNQFRKRYDYLIDEKDNKKIKKEWGRLKQVRYAPNRHIFDIRHAGSQTLRAYDVELNLNSGIFKNKEILAEGYDLYHFISGNIETETPPILQEILVDLIGALQLDGLTKSEAIELIIKEKWLDSKEDINKLKSNLENKIIKNLPNYYYKVKEVYGNYFN